MPPSFLLGRVDLSKVGLLFLGMTTVVVVLARVYSVSSTLPALPLPVASLQNYLCGCHTNFAPRMIACNLVTMMVRV